MGWLSDAWDRVVDGLDNLRPTTWVEKAAEYNENLRRAQEPQVQMFEDSFRHAAHRRDFVRRQEEAAAQQAAEQAEFAREYEARQDRLWREDAEREARAQRDWEEYQRKSRSAHTPETGPRDGGSQARDSAKARGDDRRRQGPATQNPRDLRDVTAQGYRPVNSPRTGPAAPARPSSPRSHETGRTASPWPKGPSVDRGKDVDPGLG